MLTKPFRNIYNALFMQPLSPIHDFEDVWRFLRGPIIDDSLLNHRQGSMQNDTKMHHLRTAETTKMDLPYN